MKLTSILHQNLILVGLTTIGISIAYPDVDRSISAFANQPARAIASEATPTLSQFNQFCKNLPSSHLLVRTELFFGLGKPDGSEVAELEFQQFLVREVTPQFPDGLTLLSGRGQFKAASGQIGKEPARLLVLIYPLERSDNPNQKIEQIRHAYKTTFHQGSVLRTDELTCVSF